MQTKKSPAFSSAFGHAEVTIAAWVEAFGLSQALVNSAVELKKLLDDGVSGEWQDGLWKSYDSFLRRHSAVNPPKSEFMDVGDESGLSL